jgi:hypothetical protein
LLKLDFSKTFDLAVCRILHFSLENGPYGLVLILLNFQNFKLVCDELGHASVSVFVFNGGIVEAIFAF